MIEDIKKEAARPAAKAHESRTLLIVLGTVAALLTIAAAVLAYKVTATPSYTIPDHITKNTPYPIYVPKRLPSGYEVVDGSFAISEDTLLFRAEDSSGSSLAFTEQERPENFDFEQFYQGQMQNAKKLNDTPHPSVYGKAPTGDRLLLSVVTDETWIMISTAAPLNEQDLTLIAKGLKRH